MVMTESLTCDRTGVSQDLARHDGNIVESGVKHRKPTKPHAVTYVLTG